MFISGHFFLFYFFPVVLLIQLLINRFFGTNNWWVILISALFYASFHLQFLPLLFGLLILDFFAVKYMNKVSEKKKKFLLIFGIFTCLGVLAYYKYSLFFMEIINSLVTHPLLSRFKPALLLPVGISFFTFQRISYWVDVYRGTVKPAQKLTHYLVYAAFFPQLISGPIVRYAEVESQLTNRNLTWFYIFQALKFISLGLFTKVWIADGLFVLEGNLTTNLATLSSFSVLILVLLFSLRIYFDFLGYSLLAIGLAYFFGFTFRDNFASPYRATSVQDFWRRWNITLSDWLRDYLYIPLGGSRLSVSRTYLNLLITMLLAGLWHGASWMMVLWGGLHGLALVFERVGRRILHFNMPTAVRQGLTFAFVTVAWIPFKFNNWQDLTTVIEIIKSNTWQWHDFKYLNLAINTLPYILTAVCWVLYVDDSKIRFIKPTALKTFGYLILFIFCLGWSLMRRTVPFIYFQF